MRRCWRLDGGDVNRGHVDALEARLRLPVLHLHAVENTLDVRLDGLRRFCRRRRNTDEKVENQDTQEIEKGVT